MTVKDLNAKYSIEVRDINGYRNTLIFDNKDEAYGYCSDIANLSDSNEYEIMNIVQYESIDNNTYAIVLYSALNHMAYSADWSDILGYFA